jgi:hypothetical protein
MSGVDILFDTRYRVCEANSSPGFQGLEKACKVNVPEEIFRAMERKHGLPDRPRGSLWHRLTRSLGALLGPQPHSGDP